MCQCANVPMCQCANVPINPYFCIDSQSSKEQIRMNNFFRKILLLLATCFIIIGSLSAQKVELDQAIAVAENWYKHISDTNDTDFTILNVETVSEGGEPAIYKFTLDQSQFIWVAGDDRHAPILAYNLTPGETPASVPDAYLDFQEQYAVEISKTRTENLKSTGQHPDWNNALKGSFKNLILENEVLPMMEVTWGQGGGYREFTPDNTPTGCVAVAMVQIMRHWEYPSKGQGLKEFTHNVYGDFAVNFDTVDLVWDEMPLNAPNSRIARLMFYAGIALKMNYAPDGSGANTEDTRDVLRDNFFYNDHRILSSGLSTYGRVEYWINMLKNELINGRPIIVSGHGTGGHAFNFDGFKGDHFHVNWGWSGSQNGYFLVTSLSPGSSDFSESQSCISGIFPGNMMMVDRPYNLKLLAGDEKVNLTWGGIPHKGFEYYKIYRDDVEVGQTTEKLFVDEGVTSDQSYIYSVSACYTIDSLDYESTHTPDVFCPKPSGLALPYEETFEDGYPGWSMNSGPRGFNWGTAKDLNMGSDEDSRFIGINSGTAGQNKLVCDTLVSNQVDLSETNLALLSFDYVLRQWQDIDHLYLMYRIFDDYEWVTFHEMESTNSYTNWTNYKCYLPQEALQERVQLAFYYTDNGEVGYGAGIDNIKIISVTDPGKPKFSASVTETCMGQEVIFTDQSTGARESYEWDFGPGASPRYVDSPGPHTVTYSSSGLKTVKLVLNGLDAIEEEDFLEIYRPPKARFTKSINYKTVSFNNTSTDADAYMWDFGDGIRVTQKSPTHVYQYSGDYLVRMTAISFVCGNDTTESWINLKITGKDDIQLENSISVYPNPSDGLVKISLSNLPEGLINLKLFNITGKAVLNENIPNFGQDATIEKDLSNYPPGLYFININIGELNYNKKFILY